MKKLFAVLLMIGFLSCGKEECKEDGTAELCVRNSSLRVIEIFFENKSYGTLFSGDVECFTVPTIPFEVRGFEVGGNGRWNKVVDIDECEKAELPLTE